MTHGMHDNADHHTLSSALTASLPNKITSPNQPDGRSTGEGMSNDHGTVTRIRKKPAAKLVSSPANLPAAKDRTAKMATRKRYALAN
jgi:hypothetical protein